MSRLTLIAMLSLSLAGAAVAAPEDYLEILPAAVHDMELVGSEMVEGTLVAYYGETIGRATLRVFAAPEADTEGAEPQAPSGETPSAQRALIDLLSRNLEEGTGALRAGYQTSPLKLNQIELESADDLNGMVINCGVVERLESDEDADPEKGPMGLLDNICVSQKDGDVLAVSITSPHYGEDMKSNFSQMQVAFAALLIGNLLAE